MPSSLTEACPYCSHLVVVEGAPTRSCPGCRRPLRADYRPGTEFFARWLPAEVGRFHLLDSTDDGANPNLLPAEGRGGDKALVQLVPEYGDADAAARSRFDHDVAVWQSLKHPNLVAVLDQGREGRLRYYALEQCAGDRLDVILDRLRAADKVMPFDRAHLLFRQLCRGLQALHDRGLRHEEIRPSLIVVSATGDLKILPPWMVRLDPGRSAELDGFAALARPSYYAPEQIANPGSVGPRADVYGAGMVTYEMLTGFLPRGVVRRPAVLNPSVPEWFETLLASLLDKNPEARPAALGPLADASGPALSDAGLTRAANILGGALLGAGAGAVTLYYNKGNIWLGALTGMIPGLLAGMFLSPRSSAPRRSVDPVDEDARFPAGGSSLSTPPDAPDGSIKSRG